MMYGSTKMRLLLGLAGLVILLNFADVAFSAPCPPETCRDYPTVVSFDRPNCAGQHRFVPLDVAWFQCLPRGIGNESQIEVFNDDYIEAINYRDSYCGSGIEFPDLKGVRYSFGNCINWVGDLASDHFATSVHRFLPGYVKRGGGFSYMYLRSKSQPFQAPQFPVVNPNMPNNYPDSIQCYSKGDCEAKGLFWREYFHQPGCYKVDSYSAFNVSANTCYREDNIYKSYHCVNRHTVETRVSQNSDCSRPALSEIFGGVCGRTQSSVYCNNIPSV